MLRVLAGMYNVLEQSLSIRTVPELTVGEAGTAVELVPFFSYLWPDNVKMYK